MCRTASSRLGDVSAMSRVVRALPPPPSDAVAQKRRMVAEFCHLLGARYSRPLTRSIPGLSNRHAETLERLLAGDSEKQIATRMGVSRNTVHVYVTALYRHFDVSSRGELLARFVRQPSPQK
ncbi:MAG TPA: LuxR C-terminal-related transcriptional regulator [Tepidisphaeraceae bacterium]|nr:LuxR C-terminal-related transcriptional regulator [Tepidisphaeraceae bacterium]